MQLLGLKNCIWRTPGRDVGRDIQGESFGPDFSGFVRRESWYIECKLYSRTVDWPTVWEKIAYAESNLADILLFVTSSTVSPQAIDEINRWNGSRKSPSVRFWNGQELLNRLGLFPEILVKYGLSENPVRDSAVSILSLTKILTKYANTGSAYSEFGKNRDRLDPVIHALSELISARIEEIETTGKITRIPFLAAMDGFLWVMDNELVEKVLLDRYAIRAILSIIYFHSTTDILTVKFDYKSLIIAINPNLPASFFTDIKTIAFWGSLEINVISTASLIELNNDNA